MKSRNDEVYASSCFDRDLLGRDVVTPDSGRKREESVSWGCSLAKADRRIRKWSADGFVLSGAGAAASILPMPAIFMAFRRLVFVIGVSPRLSGYFP